MNFPHIDQNKLQEKLIDVLLHAATREDLKYEINKLDNNLAELTTEVKNVESKLETQIKSLELKLETKIKELDTKLGDRIHAVELKLESMYKLGWVILGTSILIPLITKYLLH